MNSNSPNKEEQTIPFNYNILNYVFWYELLKHTIYRGNDDDDDDDDTKYGVVKCQNTKHL